MEQIIEQIKKSDRILIASHMDPDGDAVGSLLAMGRAVLKLNKQFTLFNASPIPAVYRFLPAVESIVRDLDDVNRYSSAIILDCGDLSRIGKICAQVKQIPCIINIDHHISNTGFGDHLLIDTNACATAEIIYRLIKRLEVAIDKEIGASIYTGILTDTGSFRFSNTNRAAFAISQEMTECGVDPYSIAQEVFGTYSLERIKLLNLALDSIEISGNGKVSVMTITQSMLAETGTDSEDVDGMIHYAKSIEDVRVAALIHEQHNGEVQSSNRPRYHVSLRSDGTVDVAAIACNFGGGGHSMAAGFQIEMSLKDLKSEIINLADIV
jgi:phosphoesterase RecJ-like protein